MQQTIPELLSEPRISHNAKLSRKYLDDNKVYCRWPRISEQAECIPLDISSLPKYAYNPTVIDHNGMTLMAYRFHEGTLATQLGMAHINDAGKVLSNRTLKISGQSNEDARFFRWNKQLWMSWVDSTWPEQPPKSVVRYGVFRDGTLTDLRCPDLPGNTGATMQKNYVFFSHKDTLYCIYKEVPRSAYRFDGSWVKLEDTESPKWWYGEPRGGTPPVEYNGKLLRFFHSALDNEWGSQNRRYFVGAYLMEPEPPFKVIKVTQKPILYGSELDDIDPSKRREIPQHKINVVFPCGVLVRNGYWVLSVGVNDSMCKLVKITPKMLTL